MWNGLPVVIFGTSGYAKEMSCVIEDINSQNHINQFEFLGFVSENEDEVGKSLGKYKIVTSDKTFKEYSLKFFQLGVVLSMSSYKIKRKIYNNLCDIRNIVYPNIISPFANICDINSSIFGIGNIITGGCTLSCGLNIGNFNIININATVGHDCTIGDYCSINPLSSISGEVKIKDNVLIGAGSTIMQGVTIGENSSIGLGAFVVKDVEPNSTMVCVPAKKIKSE